MLKNDKDTRPIAFSHISKTGGKAINQYIIRNKLPVKQYHHNKNVSSDKDYRTFAIVRHPYSRYVSAVNYMIYIHEPAERLVRSILKSCNKPIDLNIMDLFTEDFLSIMSIFNRQSSYNTWNKLDVIYKYENGLEVVINDLKDYYNFEEVYKLSKVNVSRQTYTVDMLTPEHKQKLNEWYHDDFVNFGYEKE